MSISTEQTPYSPITVPELSAATGTGVSPESVHQGDTILAALGVHTEEMANGRERRLEDLSAQNIESIAGSYAMEALRLGVAPNAETAQQLIDERTRLIERRGVELRINLSAASVGRLFQVGEHMTYWDAPSRSESFQTLGSLATGNGKAFHGRYRDFRASAEAGMRQYAPEGSPVTEPRYAAVTGTDDNARTFGPAPQYGNWWVQLTPRLTESSVFSFSDSHASIRQDEEGQTTFDHGATLGLRDVPRAQAVVELTREHNRSQGDQMGSLARNVDSNQLMTINGRRPGYVEALVFDHVRAGELEAVGCAIATTAELSEAGNLISEYPQVLEHLSSIYMPDSVSRLASSWIKGKARVQTDAESPNAHDTSVPEGLWESLGIDPSASYADIARSIHRASVVLYKQLYEGSQTNPYKSPSRSFESPNEVRAWDEYLKGLATDASYATTDERKQQIYTFIELQKARVFFKPQPLSQSA